MTEAYISIATNTHPDTSTPLGSVNADDTTRFQIPGTQIEIFHQGSAETGSVVVNQKNEWSTGWNNMDTILRRVLPGRTETIPFGNQILTVHHT